MAKFEEVFPDTQEAFDQHLSETQLEQYINVKVLANNSLKEIGKVIKANELVKHMTNNDIVVLLNEKIYEGLEDEQRKMVIEELLAPVHYDSEKEKVVITKADVVTHSGLLRKYTYEKYEVLKESIKTLFQVAEEEAASLQG